MRRDQLQELRKMLQHAETERDLQHFGCKSAAASSRACCAILSPKRCALSRTERASEHKAALQAGLCFMSRHPSAGRDSNCSMQEEIAQSKIKVGALQEDLLAASPAPLLVLLPYPLPCCTAPGSSCALPCLPPAPASSPVRIPCRNWRV